MPTLPWLPLPEGLEVISVTDSGQAVLVRMISQRPSSRCPVCSTPSSAIHSYYRRKPADLPCVGRPLRLLLTVKKFFCRVASCPRKVFAERLSDFLFPSSRLTLRLRAAIQAIGFASTGKGGARLAARLGLPLSDTTLLRSLHLVPLPVAEQVRLVGIDNWAWRRGHRYHASHNLAKTVIEFSVCILRAPLRERCGVAYKRAALQQDTRCERK